MAQTTGHMSSEAGRVWVSADGSAWTDISGTATTVGLTGGGKTTAETYTLDGDNPLVTSGKSTPVDYTVTGVYTEVANELFEFVRPYFEGGTVMWIRYSPRGGQTGEKMFTIPVAGRVTALTYPSLAADSGAPIMSGFTLRGQRPTVSTVA